MKKTILLLIIIISSCNSKNNYHNGTYQNSLGGIYKIKNDTLTVVNIVPDMTDSVKIVCKQYPDRIECKRQDGTVGTLIAEKNGSISDGIMFFTKIK